MSDETTTSTGPPAAATELKATTPDDDATEDTAEDKSDDPVANEAAKYRRKLRETEAERDSLRTRVEHMQRNEVQRLAADRLADPADVWRDGASITDLLDDDGHVDTTKVGGLVDGLLAAHRHWAISTGRPQLGTRSGSGASGPGEHRQASWASALNSPRQ